VQGERLGALAAQARVQLAKVWVRRLGRLDMLEDVLLGSKRQGFEGRARRRG
jgi:hypothetical protein